MLDLFFPGWVLVLADVLVFLIVGLPTHFLIRRFVSSKTPVGAVLRLLGWVVPCLVALQFRGHYGPAIRLALTPAAHRPARKFADRIERSPEIRAYRNALTVGAIAWISENGGVSPPHFQQYDLAERGLLRFSDGELTVRNDILRRTFSDKLCINVFYRGGYAIEEAIWRLPPSVQETWYEMSFQAILAEIRGTPPARRANPECLGAFAELVQKTKAVHDSVGTLGASRPQTERIDCLRITRLYSMVIEGGRADLERCLVAEVPTPASGLR